MKKVLICGEKSFIGKGLYDLLNNYTDEIYHY